MRVGEIIIVEPEGTELHQMLYTALSKQRVTPFGTVLSINTQMTGTQTVSTFVLCRTWDQVRGDSIFKFVTGKLP